MYYLPSDLNQDFWDGQKENHSSSAGTAPVPVSRTVLDDEDGLEDDRSPRKFRKARLYLLKSLRAAWYIKRARQPTEGYKDDADGEGGLYQASESSDGLYATVERPWESLVGYIDELRGLLQSPRIMDEVVVGRAYAILQHLIDTFLSLITSDKAYTKSLPKSEARALCSSGKRFERLRSMVDCPSPSHLSAGEVDLFSALPPVVLCRLADFALSPRHVRARTLDLSNLPFNDIPSLLDRLDLEALLGLFRIDIAQLTRLSLAGNDLNRFPDWSPNPLGNLGFLDVSFNLSLSYLPISLCRLPLQTIRTRYTSLHSPLPSYRTGSRQLPSGLTCSQLSVPKGPDVAMGQRNPLNTLERKGLPSLVHLTVLSLLKGIPPSTFKPHEQIDVDAMCLPLHLEDLVKKALSCELCSGVVLPGQVGWIDGMVDIDWTVRAERGEEGELRHGVAVKTLRTRGRLCLGCRGGLEVVGV